MPAILFRCCTQAIQSFAPTFTHQQFGTLGSLVNAVALFPDAPNKQPRSNLRPYQDIDELFEALCHAAPAQHTLLCPIAMVPNNESNYFPPLEECLSNKELLMYAHPKSLNSKSTHTDFIVAPGGQHTRASCTLINLGNRIPI